VHFGTEGATHDKVALWKVDVCRSGESHSPPTADRWRLSCPNKFNPPGRARLPKAHFSARLISAAGRAKSRSNPENNFLHGRMLILTDSAASSTIASGVMEIQSIGVATMRSLVIAGRGVVRQWLSSASK